MTGDCEIKELFGAMSQSPVGRVGEEFRQTGSLPGDHGVGVDPAGLSHGGRRGRRGSLRDGVVGEFVNLRQAVTDEIAARGAVGRD